VIIFIRIVGSIYLLAFTTGCALQDGTSEKPILKNGRSNLCGEATSLPAGRTPRSGSGRPCANRRCRQLNARGGPARALCAAYVQLSALVELNCTVSGATVNSVSRRVGIRIDVMDGARSRHRSAI